MKIYLYIALLLLSVITAQEFTYANELEETDKISDLAEKLFSEEKFEELSMISKKYIDNEERTSSGLWKLTFFYVGIESYVHKIRKDEKKLNEAEEKALRWVKNQPASPSGYISYSLILINRAWIYRGGGWAYEVKEEAWGPYYKKIAQARKNLLDNYQIASNDPCWYQYMLKISFAEGWDIDSFNLLFNESVEKYPYFYENYFKAATYLSPKWHGSRNEVELFAQRAVELTKKKENKGIYVRIYWYLFQNSSTEDPLFIGSNTVWSNMKKSMDDVLDIYPEQWNINSFAHLSCIARDKDNTRKLLDKIKGEPILQAWGSEYAMMEYNACKDFAAK
jgi:hypothetical protein